MLKRQEEIINLLNSSKKPISGSKLGEIFQVTRQVIVKDIALIRANGSNIVSTNRGYIIPHNSDLILKRFIAKHSSLEEMEEELNTIVDFGGKIKDITIDHPIYGEISTELNLNNRNDIGEFIKNLNREKGQPLSNLTHGIHTHTIYVDREETFEKIIAQLDKLGYLTK